MNAGVIGREDEQWGEVPVAFIVKKAPITEEKFWTTVERNLLNIKFPMKSILLMKFLEMHQRKYYEGIENEI